MAETTGNTSLFPVFVLTILSIVLFPWTVYRTCCATSADAAKLWETADKKRSLLRKLRSFITPGNVVLLLLWVLWAFLVVHISQTQKDMTPFDPFAILEVEHGATTSEIKKAFRQKSLIYHPDKSSNPEHHKYFAEFVTKAHQALTDPVAKENYEKYGHPDGQQSMDLGIALPEWLFTKDPRALLVLVLVFILLPLSTMAWYLFRSDKFTGPNGVMHETLYNYVKSKHNIKESQGIVRIPETLVVAKEFIMIHTPNDHQPALEELRRLTLSFHPELKEKPQFWKRRASVVKAHMLFYAHLERVRSEVPQILHANMNFVMEKSIPLMQEMFKLACFPRSPYGHGWLVMKRDFNEGYAALLQLPGMDGQIARILAKKRVRNIKDLLEKEEAQRTKILHGLDFSEETLQNIDTCLQAMPTIDMSAEIFVTDEEEIQEGDVVTCRVRLVLTRRSHATGDVSDADLAGNGVLCFSPYFPVGRPEKWYIIVALPSENRIICWEHIVLTEAEIAGLRRSTDQDEEAGQVVEMQFPALFEGTFDVHVGCYSDCWIGSDKVVPLKLTIKKATKTRSATKPTPQEFSSDDEDRHDISNEQGSQSAKGANSSEEEREEGEDDAFEYDSEETGELETGTDEEEAPELDASEQ